jgi:hypothetical protein
VADYPENLYKPLSMLLLTPGAEVAGSYRVSGMGPVPPLRCRLNIFAVFMQKVCGGGMPLYGCQLKPANCLLVVFIRLQEVLP